MESKVSRPRHGVQHPQTQTKHAFASSWKVRYAYLLDCVSQGKKCRRCRTRGHLPSACTDPLPEVPFPTLSSEQQRELGKLKLVNYEEPDEGGASSWRGGRREPSVQRDDQRSQQGEGHSSRPYERSHREPSAQRNDQRSQQGEGHASRPYERGYRDDHRGDPAADRRSNSRERSYRNNQPPDIRSDSRGYGGSHDRGNAQHPRDSSVQRSTVKNDNCFRCDRPGHRASDCRADTHANGQPLQARARTPSPHGGR